MAGKRTTMRDLSSAQNRLLAHLARLFPNLAELEPVKWLGIAIALFWGLGILIGITSFIFGSRVID